MVDQPNPPDRDDAIMRRIVIKEDLIAELLSGRSDHGARSLRRALRRCRA